MMMYARAVWLEEGKEMEGTIPDVWTDMVLKTVRWPKKKVKYCFQNHVLPEEDWETFTLLKKKFVAESARDCDEYNLSSQAEDVQDDEEEVLLNRRSKKKRTFEEFVPDILEIPNIPPFPVPPKKVKRSNNGSATSQGEKGESRERSPPCSSTSEGETGESRERSTPRSSKSDSRGRSTARSSRSYSRERSTPPEYSSSRSYSREKGESRERSTPHARSPSISPVKISRSKFPVSEAKFQKIVITKMVCMHDDLKKLLTDKADPGSYVKKMVSMEEFQEKDQETFNNLVHQLARVGGRDAKDCTHKVLDRLFTNQLMSKFNLKGKGNKDKCGLENTMVFSVVKAAVMQVGCHSNRGGDPECGG